MSQLVDASEIGYLAAGIERRQRCTETARDHVVRALRNYPRLLAETRAR
jgi:hypothetical protein